MVRLGIILAVLIIIGGALSFMLVPVQEELEYMRAGNVAVAERKAYYEKRVAEGVMFPAVVKPLVEIYVKSGQFKEAITLQENYLKNRPQDVEAYEKLAELYMFSGQVREQAETLEKLYVLKNDAKYLETLSSLYNASKEYEKQVVALQKLHAANPQNMKYATDLAQILMLLERHDEAGQIMEKMLAENRDAPFEARKITIFTRLKRSSLDEAFNEAKFLLKQNLTPDEAYELASMFPPEQALQIIAESKYEPQVHPKILVLYVRSEIAVGNNAAAYKKMQELNQIEALPAELLDLYVDQAMQHNDRTALIILFQKQNPEHLEPERLLNLIVFAQKSIDSLMDILSTKISNEYLDAHPDIAVLVGLYRGSEDIYATMEKAAKAGLSIEKKMILAEAVKEAGYDDWQAYFLDQLKPYSQVPAPLLTRLAYLFIAAGQEKEGVAQFKKLRGIEAERGLALLAAKNGEGEFVERWLSSTPKANITEALLKDIFFAATENKQYSLAAKSANLLYSNYPSNENRLHLASSLLNSKKPIEALVHLRALKNQGFETEPFYLDALYAAAKTNPVLRDELLTELKSNLASSEGDRQKRIVQAMVENGAAAEVLDYIEIYALKEKGSWIYLYEDSLKKLNRQQKLDEFYLKLVKENSLPNKEKRRIAFLLLEKGARYEAEEIFFKLALKEGPESKDMQQLMYLWGSRLEPDQIEFLVKRAEVAPAFEKGSWVKLMLEHGAEQRALEVMKKEGIKDEALYMAALARTGSEKELEKYLAENSKSQTNQKELEEVAKIAMSQGFYDAAKNAYLDVLSQDAKNVEALKNLGIIYYETGETAKAQNYLEKYVSLAKEQEYKPLYYLAEGKDKDDKTALLYYSKVVDKLEAEEKLTTPEKQILMASLYRLGREAEAELEKKELIDASYGNSAVKADIAATLLDYKKYDAAKNLLKTTDYIPAASGYATSVPGQGLIRVRTTKKPHELMLYYDRPIEQSKAAQEFLNDHPEWIGSASPGYDYILLSAAPGWQYDYFIQISGNVQITLEPMKKTKAAQNKNEFIRMELLSARLERETGKPGEAKARIEKLYEKYSSDSAVSTSLASEELARGRIIRAEKLVENVPANEQSTWLRDNIALSRAPKIFAAAGFIERDNRREYITEAAGSIQANPNVRIGNELAINNAEIDEGIQSSNGSLSADEQTKFRNEIYVEYDFENGLSSRSSLYINGRRVGIGQRFIVPGVYGETEFFGEYQKSNWDFTEGVLADATRDSLGLFHRFNFAENIPGFIGASYNNYSTENARDVSQSFKTLAGIRVPLDIFPKQAKNTKLSLGYTLDAEYRIDAERGINDNGDSYLLYPLITREVHFGDISLNHSFSEAFIGSAYIGYAYDRLGGQGLAFGSRLFYEKDKWRLGLAGSHSISTTFTDSDENRINIFLERKF